MRAITLFEGLTFVVRDSRRETYLVKRNWRERLFTYPWKPLTTSKVYVDEQAIASNKEVYSVGGVLYATEKQIKHLQQELK